MRLVPYIFLLLLSSCTLNQMNPGTDLDYEFCDHWKGAAPNPSDCAVTTNWWEEYHDFCLNKLEEQALVNNYDLNIAATRVLQARALAGIATSTRFPHANLDVNYTREEALVTLADFGLGSHNVRIEERQIGCLLDLCYEVDLWGKYRNLQKAACEQLCASTYTQAAIIAALTADIAALYFTIRTLDEEIHYLQKALEIREDYLAINVERLQRGLDCEIDVTRAHLDLALARSEYEDTKRLRMQKENALALLLGANPSCFSLEVGLLPPMNIVPPLALPSSLVAKRPDIQERMHFALAALAEIGVARAECFPQFSLSAALGTVSPNLDLLFNWQSRFWALAVNACQALFDGGRRVNTLHLKQADYLQTLLEYQRQIILAFTEVEDALNEMHYRRNQFEAQEQAVLFSQDTALLARCQYESGLINYLQVADAEKHNSMPAGSSSA